VAIATGEPGFRELMVRLGRYERLFSSNLLEAEVRGLFWHGSESRGTLALYWPGSTGSIPAGA